MQSQGLSEGRWALKSQNPCPKERTHPSSSAGHRVGLGSQSSQSHWAGLPPLLTMTSDLAPLPISGSPSTTSSCCRN